MNPFGKDVYLEERVRLGRALSEAYAPLRGAHAAISPARVRARVRWERHAEPSAGWRGALVVARLSEVSVAFAVSALFFVGALGVAEPPRSVSDDEPVLEAAFVPQAFDASRLAEDPNYIRLQAFSARADFYDLLAAAEAAVEGPGTTSTSNTVERTVERPGQPR